MGPLVLSRSDMIGVIQICIGILGLFASILGFQFWRRCKRETRLDEENTLRPGAIQIPDEIASKYYNTSNIQEIQDSPLPYTHPLQKPPAAKLKSNLWIPHALPTLILIIYLDEKDKKSKNEGFQVHVT